VGIQAAGVEGRLQSGGELGYEQLRRPEELGHEPVDGPVPLPRTPSRGVTAAQLLAVRLEVPPQPRPRREVREPAVVVPGVDEPATGPAKLPVREVLRRHEREQPLGLAGLRVRGDVDRVGPGRDADPHARARRGVPESGAPRSRTGGALDVLDPPSSDQRRSRPLAIQRRSDCMPGRSNRDDAVAKTVGPIPRSFGRETSTTAGYA